MPKRITNNMTLDDVEEEILFTQAALHADPDAEQYLPLTDTWLTRCDTQRAQEREVRRRVAIVDAARIIANAHLDQACIHFTDDLHLDVGKDRTSRRWTQFLNLPVSQFIRTSLSTQVPRVKVWLQSTDPVLVKHKPELERWTTKADEALVNTRSLALARGESAINRGQFNEDLTNDRDGLHSALMQRAREQKLGRDWPNAFFRTSTRRGAPAEDVEETASETPPLPTAT